MERVSQLHSNTDDDEDDEEGGHTRFTYFSNSSQTGTRQKHKTIDVNTSNIFDVSANTLYKDIFYE
jgi:hypothetical protein